MIDITNKKDNAVNMMIICIVFLVSLNYINIKMKIII